MSIPVFRFALREDLKGDKRFLPTRATSRSTGWDVRCATLNKKPITLRAGQYVKIPLGFRMAAPVGWWLKLEPRSSSFAKKSLHCLYGTLDNDFFGSVLLASQYIPDVNSLAKDLVIEFGEAIGQIIPFELKEMRVEEITNEQLEDLCLVENNERGTGGFGSTSK